MSKNMAIQMQNKAVQENIIVRFEKRTFISSTSTLLEAASPIPIKNIATLEPMAPYQTVLRGWLIQKHRALKHITCTESMLLQRVESIVYSVRQSVI